MKIAVIMVHFGDARLTEATISQLQSKISGQMFILVNNSSEDCGHLARIIDGTRYIDNRKNLGFARAVNQGIELAHKMPGIEGFLLLNNDLHLVNGSLDSLMVTMSHKPLVGIVAPLLHHAGGYDWGGKLNHWSGLVKHQNYANKPKTLLKVNHVAGAAMLISRETYEKVGKFDERFFLYYEDADYNLRVAQAGLGIYITPSLVAEHQISAGTNLRRRILYQWKSHLQFVNKNLFKGVYPSAYLTDIIFYPLIYLKSGLL